MELSQKQKQAILLAGGQVGTVSTDEIAGATGASLCRKRLMRRHWIAAEVVGETTVYSLTSEGWRVYYDMVGTD